MKFAKTSIEEQEVVIQLDRKTGLARICSSWPRLTKQLSKRYGPPKDVSENKTGQITSALFEVEASLIKFTRPRKSRPLTEAQLRARKALSERMRVGRFARESLVTT